MKPAKQAARKNCMAKRSSCAKLERNAPKDGRKSMDFMFFLFFPLFFLFFFFFFRFSLHFMSFWMHFGTRPYPAEAMSPPSAAAPGQRVGRNPESTRP